jgi:UDPglucose 6-dehydrogenase
MKITTIGAGYVGLVTGTCLAEISIDVVCLDVDANKIALLNNGDVPIYEPGLKELIHSNRVAGRLSFTTDAAEAVAHGDVIFIAVGTPSDEDDHADLQYVLAAARSIGDRRPGSKWW